jgi:hypothetical protein
MKTIARILLVAFVPAAGGLGRTGFDGNCGFGNN